MTIIHQVGPFDSPNMICEQCEMDFQIIWARSLVYEKPEYCPFCGEEIEEWLDETSG